MDIYVKMQSCNLMLNIFPSSVNPLYNYNLGRPIRSLSYIFFKVCNDKIWFDCKWLIIN